MLWHENKFVSGFTSMERAQYCRTHEVLLVRGVCVIAVYCCVEARLQTQLLSGGVEDWSPIIDCASWPECKSDVEASTLQMHCVSGGTTDTCDLTEGAAHRCDLPWRCTRIKSSHSCRGDMCLQKD